jgi:hypothetical protein
VYLNHVRLLVTKLTILNILTILTLLNSIVNVGIQGTSAIDRAISVSRVLNVCKTALPALLGPMVRFGHPFGGLPGLDSVIVQLIDLFKRQALGFRDAEIGEDETAETRRSPDEKHFDSESSIPGSGLDQVWGGITNTEIPEPIGGSGHGHGFGTNTLRKLEKAE